MTPNLAHRGHSRKNRTTQTSTKKRQFGCLPTGCLVTITIVIAPYILHAVYLLGGSLLNQMKWQQRGSSNYIATVDVSFPSSEPINGVNKITVLAGNVIAAESNSWPDANNYLRAYDRLTIESMFSRIKNCVIYFPLEWCSFKYDTYYGYPKEVMIDCPYNICMTRLRVEGLEIIKP